MGSKRVGVYTIYIFVTYPTPLSPFWKYHFYLKYDVKWGNQVKGVGRSIDIY